MAVPNNIVWAFYSQTDYETVAMQASMNGRETPKDTWYKDTKGTWVKSTAVFECIDQARRNYRQPDCKYLGPVLADTKAECARGAKFPVEAVPTAAEVEEKLKKKKISETPGQKGTIYIKNRKISYWDVPLYPPTNYNLRRTYWDNWDTD